MIDIIDTSIRIKNIEAGSLYEHNLGVRESFRYTNAVLTNSLFLDFLLNNGLKIWKGTMSRDVIGIDFECGSRSFEEEIAHLQKTRKEYEQKNLPASVEKIDLITQKAYQNKDLYDKKSKEQIREIFYQNGVTVKYITKKKNGDIKKIEEIHYKMLFRSTGKAKKGSCIFIKDRLYNRAIDFLRMGIKLPYHNAPIVEISAYSPLVASSIIDTIKIKPEQILIIKDFDSTYYRNAVSVETNDSKQSIVKYYDTYKMQNTLFDGQALIDSSIFPSWGNGYLLLRHHFCKMAAFDTNIQQYFKDYFGDIYEYAQVTDMWGNKHFAKDIKLITTDNAIKWLKFDVTYEQWADRVRENGCYFGIVKTAHKSKLGEVQRMSYQMVNSLDISIMPEVAQTSIDYIYLLKQNDEIFLDYLRKNQNFANDFEVLTALVEHNPDFIRSDFFRQRRKSIISGYTMNFKSGHINQNGDNLVIVGSPYAMLMASVGLNPEDDPTFITESDSIQCFTKRFNSNEYLAEFRSPFNAKENMGYLHNIYHPLLEKYFILGSECIAINMVHTDFQNRNNGSDQDSDSIYCTNQPQIVNYAKYCYNHYPTIVNNIPKEKQIYCNTLLDFATMDNNLAQAQMAIGESSNLAQLALTYTYNFPNEQKYQDYVCILSVLAQAAIDNAKRKYDIDLAFEIKRIKQDMDVKTNGYPVFWKIIRPDFNRSKINYNLQCPMNYLYYINLQKFRSTSATLEMDYFFHPYLLTEDRRRCRKVEDLIYKYQLNLSAFVSNGDNDNDNFLLLRDDFDQLIVDISQVYLSKDYLGLVSWLVDRAFCITPYAKMCAGRFVKQTSSKLCYNKALLLKVLYKISPNSVIKIFSGNL